LRFAHEHFVGLDDAAQALRPIILDPVQEAVAPAKRRVAVYAGLVCSGAHRP